MKEELPMLITIKTLQKYRACIGPGSGTEWFLSKFNKGIESRKLLKEAIKDGKQIDSNWLIVRLLNKKDKIRYAVFAAKQVLPIFEKIFPKNKQPRLAIESAEKVIRNNTSKNRIAADNASIIYSSTLEAIPYPCNEVYKSASRAAYSTTNSPWPIDAIISVSTSVICAVRAIDEATKQIKIFNKILFYGLKLLEKKGRKKDKGGAK
jgi:hypothetical protein